MKLWCGLEIKLARLLAENENENPLVYYHPNDEIKTSSLVL